MVCAAAGMALEGYRPICLLYRILNDRRAYEADPVSVCTRNSCLDLGAQRRYTVCLQRRDTSCRRHLALMSALPA